MAGGVALNCVANGKIYKEKIFEKIWIQPAAGDAGGALGAALGIWHKELKQERLKPIKDNMNGSYLGPSFSNEEIRNRLTALKATFKKFSEEKLLKITADELSKGKTIGWFQGKMEFGPRALGARSIIADPRSETMQKKLNLKIKYRENFRPFAPTIIREDLSEWFDLDCDSPYMLLVANINNNIKKEMTEDEKKLFGIEKLNVKRSDIPAVTHVDYSARIQTVHENTNPRYYKLIKNFKNITKCPVIVNTSFNIRGEPIVCSIEDAYKCFMGTDLDMLVCEDYILYKEKQKELLSEDYKNKYDSD